MRQTLTALVLLACLAFGAEAAQAVPAFSIDDPTVAEGTGTNTTATFTVTLSEPAPAGGLEVDFVTPSQGNTAEQPADFTATHGTLEFAPGETQKTFEVPVVGDSKDEFDETFRVQLADVQPPGAATLGKPTGVATITDDDAPPTVTVEDTLVQGGSVSTGTNRLVIFNVKLSGPSGKLVHVDYATADPPAGVVVDGHQPAEACDPAPAQCSQRAHGDYQPLNGRLTFQPGITAQQVSVVAIGDSLDVNKYFHLNVMSRSHLQSNTATFTPAQVGDPITVAGQANEIAAFVNAREVVLRDPVENGSNVSFIVHDPPNPDVTHIDGTVTGGTHQTIADGQAVGKIPSAGPSARITGVTVNEGGPGQTTSAQLAVTLADPAPQELSMAYASADGTARAPADYERIPAGRRVVFQPGTTTATFSVPVKGNDLHEADKSFSVTLSDPKNVTLTAANATAVVTIRNDDPSPGIVAPDVSVAEPRAGTTATAVVDVSLSAPSTRTLTAPYSTRDGSAVAGVNYGQTNGTLTFSPGETTKRIEIPIAGNGAVTEDLSFSVVIQNTVDGGGEVVARVVLIESDLTADVMPGLGINDVSVRDSGRDGAEAVFTVRMDRPLGRSVSVDYATADGTARAPGDYTAGSGRITIPAGATSQVIGVPVNVSGRRRRNESFSVVLSNPVGVRVFDDTGAGIIIADTEESLPVRMSSSTVRGSSVLCRRGRRCRGLLVGWRAPASGKVRISVTAVMPASRRRGARSSQRRMKRVSLVKKTYRVRSGSRRVRVRRSASRRTSRLLRQLRRGRARTVIVTVSFTDRIGARRYTRVERRLRP